MSLLLAVISLPISLPDGLLNFIVFTHFFTVPNKAVYLLQDSILLPVMHVGSHMIKFIFQSFLTLMMPARK